MARERDDSALAEVIITEEMISAGQDVLWSYDREADASDEAVKEIFLAMLECAPFRRLCQMPNRLVPRDHGSIAALKELGDFAIARPELVERINRFLEVDAPIFRCQVDWCATEATGDLVAIYEPSLRLISFLATLRAGKVAESRL